MENVHFSKHTKSEQVIPMSYKLANRRVFVSRHQVLLEILLFSKQYFV